MLLPPEGMNWAQYFDAHDAYNASRQQPTSQPAPAPTTQPTSLGTGPVAPQPYTPSNPPPGTRWLADAGFVPITQLQQAFPWLTFDAQGNSQPSPNYPVSGSPATPTSPMQQQMNTGPTAPQPYTPQVGAPATTPAPNPFQPFMDAMAQYNQQFTGLQQQYAGQIADYNQQYNQQAQAQTQQQTQQVADYNRQYSGQLPSAPQPTPQSAATPPAAPPQQFPGTAPQGFPGQNINPFTEALGNAGSSGFGGWNQPQRRQRPQPFSFGGSRY